MKREITSEKIPIKLWLDYLEDGAKEQAKNLANFPFAFKHIAIMPDSHQGFGMPIGGVMATKGVVVPNAVGVDIGCGMCAVKTTLTEIDKDTLKAIMGDIRDAIPVGKNRHGQMQDEKFIPKGLHNPEFNGSIVWQEKSNALESVGTLGGGNHFIEIQKGSDGFIWIMVHSGSRNMGLKVANHYNKIAKELNSKWKSEVPPSWDLAFLPLDSEEGKNYIREMKYCVDYALANRRLMMDRVKIIFCDNIEDEFGGQHGVEFDDMINIAHNYAKMENHFGHNVTIHRKGATSARKDEWGIIPGSQGTKSYIVKGLGNMFSFDSCSHGAGRLMSRKKAKEKLDLEVEKKKLDDLGVVHGMRNIGDLDEAPGAYKNIDEVMENQKDLVSIEVELIPIAVIKA